jgi:hypothetical protein
MATTPRQQIASPQSFTSDPLEQVFAKQMGDATTGGYALANMILAGSQRERGQEQYLQNLKQSNDLAAALARQDMETDLTKEALQQGHNYLGKGVDPNEIPLIGRLFRDANASSGPDRAAALHRALVASQIAENQAKAAHAGDAGAPTLTYAQQTDTYGEGGAQFTGKGRNPAEVQRMVEAAVANKFRNPPVRVLPPPPGSPGTPGGAAQSFQANKYPQ